MWPSCNLLVQLVLCCSLAAIVIAADFSQPATVHPVLHDSPCLQSFNARSVPCDAYAGMLAGQPYAVAHYFSTAVFCLVKLTF